MLSNCKQMLHLVSTCF